MVKTKVFMSGDSQAVRIPKDFRFTDTEVYIEKVGDVITLRPTTKSKWEIAREALMNFSDDFMIERDQPPMQERPELDKLFK